MTVDIREEDAVELADDALLSRAPTRLRVAPTRIEAIKTRTGGITTTLFGLVAALFLRHAATEDALSSVPLSLREVWQRTWARDWVPGDQAKWLEALGVGYGLLVAVPATAIGLAVVWMFQKPTQLGLVGLVVGLGWIASGMLW